MVIVHVWDSAWGRFFPGGRAGSPGHASIQLSRSATTPGAGYASLHPGADGAFNCTSREFRQLNVDVANYVATGQRHFRREIIGLNEDNMNRAWQAIFTGGRMYCGDPTESGSMFTCSSLVQELLRAGGSQRHASGWGSRRLFTTSPADLLDYVDSMRGSGLVITPPR
jgi:hypothetical protein